MPQNDLEIRMENLEHTVAGLTGLPQQVENLSTRVQDLSTQVQDLSTQVLQLREEVRAEVSAVRDEVHGVRDELREDMASMHRDLAAVIATNHAQTLTLHEDLVQRITLLGGKLPRVKNPRTPKGPR